MELQGIQTIAVWIMLLIGLVCVLYTSVQLGLLSQDPNKASEIRKELSIIAIVNGIAVFLFGGAAYIYFNANVNYLTPFLLIMSFVNLFLSLYATSAATLQVVVKA